MPILSGVRLGYWNLSSSDDSRDEKLNVAIEDTRAALREHGLNPERAEAVPESTAARRAVGTIVGKNPDTGTVLFARAWTRKKDGLLTFKVSSQREDDNGHMHYLDHSEYELTKESGIRQLNGAHDEFLRVRTAYRHALDHYTGSDLTKVIQGVLTQDGLGAYPCKKNGGVYFIPIRSAANNLIDGLARFCSDVGVRFLTYDVPDLSSQRDEIAEAVANSLTQDLDQHNAAITAYTSDAKLGVLTNRREAIAATATLISNLSGLLNGKAGQLNGRIAELITMLDAKEQAIEAAAQTKRAQGPSRRIVTTTPVATHAIETPALPAQQPASLF